MNKLKTTCICLAALSLVLAVLLIGQIFGFPISMAFSGIDTDTAEHLSYRYTDHGKEYSVFTGFTTDGEVTLVRAAKGLLGFWYIDLQKTTGRDDPHISMMWICDARWGSTSHIYQPDYGWLTHKVYCGTDAKGKIEILPEQIPEGFTLNIQQNGDAYLIHVICFGDYETGNGFDVWAILSENGCIAE